MSAWLIWKCVQFHGAKLCAQLESGWWPDRAVPRPAVVVVSELDSTYLKRQQRGRNRELPVAHFPVHLGVNYSGRKRRYERRGSTAVSLHNKRWIASAQRLPLFGRRLAWQRLRHYGQAKCEVILSDGDEGLERVRENEFAHATWLLDRWHIARAMRDFVWNDETAYRRLMRPVWQSDSEALLRALAASPFRESRPEQFHTLFGYILGNREGIDNWHQIPAALPALDRSPSGSRAQRQRSDRKEHRSDDWSPLQTPGPKLDAARGRTSPSAPLAPTTPPDWNHWWTKTALAKTKVNPGWPSSPRPPN